MKELPNLKYIKTLSGDDTTFEQKFISVLKKEFPEEMQHYLDCLKKPIDFKAAAEIVHKLKHKFNILSLKKAYVLAVSYEEELLNKNNTAHKKFNTILKQIETYLKTI